ncbi:MAG: phosphoglycolate/pyridoxal phosphate family phosphatase [Hadesarchaea archaeon]|nr:phosphoglycolate/pyridoxal phosphate family phosphatase [Hadesarchaea archaeon]
MNEIEALILDMDGVIYLGETPIEGAKEAIDKLREQGKELIFMTNNSTKTRSDYVEKLESLGIKTTKEEIITSAYATATYLQKNSGENKKVFVIGEEGLKSELREAGFKVLSKNEASNAAFVITGMDRNLNYSKITAGLNAILNGAEFIATNPDPTYPTEEGLAPGAGASIGALTGTAEKEPSFIVGKPSEYMIKIALENTEISTEEAAIIGDRIGLDIKVGRKSGLTTILVLSGVSTKNDFEEIKDTEKAPDFLLTSISELRRI